MAGRFANVDSSLQVSKASLTKSQNKKYVEKYRSMVKWVTLRGNKLLEKYETEEELDKSSLSQFYSEVRKQEGKAMSMNQTVSASSRAHFIDT